MNQPHLCIIICHDLQQEMDTILRNHVRHDYVITYRTFPPICVDSVAPLGTLLSILEDSVATYDYVWLLGGACLDLLPDSWRSHDQLGVWKCDSCAAMLMMPEIVRHEQRQGAWVVTPGALTRLSLYLMTGLGCAPREICVAPPIAMATELVLLDSGLIAESEQELLVCAQRIGCSARVIPVGVEFLRMRVQTLVLEWRAVHLAAVLEETRAHASEQQANHDMILDLVGRMTRMRTETEVIAAIFDLFAMLSAPQRQYYLPCHDGIFGHVHALPPSAHPSPAIEEALAQLDGSTMWSECGNGFVVRITYQDGLLGLLHLDEFLFAEYREHYLNMALMLVPVCGLAIINARTYEALQNTLNELNAAMEQLSKARDAAESANRTKSIFLANMSHEIRTPLNAIIGMTDLLLGTELTPDQQDFADTVQASGLALLAIINDILDFSKIEAGKLELEYHPFHLRTCIEEALDQIAFKADQKQINLAYRYDPHTPEYIVGDMNRVRQILFNLLSNAIKFTDQGEVVLSVMPAQTYMREGESAVVSSTNDTSFLLHISVYDTGIGISADQISQLFQSFSQLDGSTTRKYGGTGLGLAISKQLATMMGGRIWVQSEPGNGSTFHVTFLAQKVTAESVVANEQTMQQQHRVVPPVTKELPVSLETLQGRQIVCASPWATNRSLFAYYLESWGMEALIREEFSVVHELLYVHPMPDMLLLDVHQVEPETMRWLSRIATQCQRHVIPIVLVVPIRPEPLFLNHPQLKWLLSQSRPLNRPIKPAQLLQAILGSLVSMARPSRPVASFNPHTDQKPGATLSPAKPPSSLRILLAEDNIFNQKVATRILERLSYHADVVTNGCEVLETLQRQRYDLILMDVQMPMMDGLEATQTIRATYPPTQQPYIIAMTANAMQGDRERCLAAGVDDYLSKPVRMQDLMLALERMVAQGRYAVRSPA